MLTMAEIISGCTTPLQPRLALFAPVNLFQNPALGFFATTLQVDDQIDDQKRGRNTDQQKRYQRGGRQ